MPPNSSRSCLDVASQIRGWPWSIRMIPPAALSHGDVSHSRFFPVVITKNAFSSREILGIWECLTGSHLMLRDLPRKNSRDKSGVLVNPGVGIRLRRSQGSSRGSGSACRGKSFAGSWEWSWNHTLDGREWAQIPTWNRCRDHPPLTPSDGIFGDFSHFSKTNP